MSLKIWPPLTESEGEPESEKFRRLIDQAWPDNQIFWSRNSTRSNAVCLSPEAEEWQCGSLGPRGFYCHRDKAHSGKCTNLIGPVDRRVLAERLIEMRKEEFEEILGRPVRETTLRYNIDKLKKVLRGD